MNRDDFRQLAEVRLKEAKVLLDAKLYEGSYYLAGYSIECALKACIAAKTRQYDFPDKGLANRSHTHDLEKLIEAAELENSLKQEIQLNLAFGRSWSVVKDWDETKRYETGIPSKTAEDLYQAISDPKDGVLQWLKKWW